MDNQRLLLFIALSFVVLLMWDAWSAKNQPEIIVSTNNIVSDVAIAPESSAIAITPSENSDIGSSSSVPNDKPDIVVDDVADRPTARVQTALTSNKRIRVETDVFDIDIDVVGGDLRRAFLKRFPIDVHVPDKFYPLMDDALPQLFIAQTGLLSKTSAPDHHAIFSSEQSNVTLREGQNEVKVVLDWVGEDGLKVTKIYTFRRDSYLISIDHVIENNTASEWNGRLYRQFQRNEYDEPGKSRLLYTYTGGAVSTPEEPYEKIDFQEMEDWKPTQSYFNGGWVAMLQHYFVSAWVPAADEVNHFYARSINNTRYILGLTSTEISIPAGSATTLSANLYVGPKEQERLERISDNLKLTVDYGFLTIIAQPLFWVLEWLHSKLGNWGFAIVFLTLLIKLVFYKLSAASYRSMANMRKLAPKFQAIRERYGEDRQKMSAATMELYKKEKVNPLSGCWPMLVQIPVFISLYWMLLESVEIRQAPFILWIDDLSAKDPFYVLPLLMGISMYVQQKLSHNPALDPMHQKIMNFMPIIFTLFFMLFPSGLVLYWVVNNLLSIAQQWYITKQVEKATQKG